MTTQDRKQRALAERRRLIVTTARELAESEGWDAVTTRKLAERIGYSQPVLYSHFAGKLEIVAAVALEGAAELTEVIREARTGRPGPAEAAESVVRAYHGFAERHPAVFDALFSMPTGLVFGGPDSPEELKAAFGELVATFGPLAGERDVETFTEMAWSAMHGQVILARSGRLRPDFDVPRRGMLAEALAG